METFVYNWKNSYMTSFIVPVMVKQHTWRFGKWLFTHFRKKETCVTHIIFISQLWIQTYHVKIQTIQAKGRSVISREYELTLSRLSTMSCWNVILGKETLSMGVRNPTRSEYAILSKQNFASLLHRRSVKEDRCTKLGEQYS